MPDAVLHPTPQELTAFALGKLPERAAAAVAAHLEKCSACRQFVAGVSSDTFLDKVRAAGPAGSSFPPSLAQPAMPTVPTPDIPPELARHPKYLILRELNRGGMGIVYQARQTMMNRQVVIKVINRALLEQPGMLERFHREIRAAAQLSHPNIVTAYDAEQSGDLHMLVMEFVPGQSLAEILEKKGPLPVAHACHAMRQAASGLQHAHERNMVHRDIKPSNLIRMPKGQVKILDFGLAKIISESGTRTGITATGDYMGTPDYMAPEQSLDAAKADIRADIYSLGCTLYCLLAGRPPFQEDTAMKTVLAHMQKQPQPLTELRPDVPERLWRVIARLLAKEPIRRYQKPSEVVLALAPFVKSSSKDSSAPAAVVGSPVKGTVIETDSEIEKIQRKIPDKTPPKEVPAKEETSPLANRVDAPAKPKKAKEATESTKRLPAVRHPYWLVLAGMGIVLLALVGMWASDVFKVKPENAPPQPMTLSTERTQQAAHPSTENKNEPAPPPVREAKAAEAGKKSKREDIAPPPSAKPQVKIPDDASVDDLRQALKHEDPAVRAEAAGRLSTLGPEAEPAMYALAETLTDAKNWIKVRTLAALAIAKIGAKAKPVVPALAKSLKRSQPLEIRQYAADALAEIRYPANKEAVPDILDAIENDKYQEVRLKCIFALFGMPKAEFTEAGAGKLLTKVLDERDEDTALVRYSAARKLAQIFQEEAPAKTADVLLEMLKNTRLKVYNRTDVKVVGSRSQIEPNLGGDARYMAAEALGWLGKKASSREDVRIALQNATKDSDTKLRESAAQALKALGIH